MMYWTCPYCGANLDPEEECDCDGECTADAIDNEKRRQIK